ncbi:MAG: hypothetical protein QXT45_03395 [Candidatus Bilamarchaeaceae archaeon]
MHPIIDQQIQPFLDMLKKLDGVTYVTYTWHEKYIQIDIFVYTKKTSVRIPSRLPKYTKSLDGSYALNLYKRNIAGAMRKIFTLYKVKLNAIKSGLSTMEREFSQYYYED